MASHVPAPDRLANDGRMRLSPQAGMEGMRDHPGTCSAPPSVVFFAHQHHVQSCPRQRSGSRDGTRRPARFWRLLPLGSTRRSAHFGCRDCLKFIFCASGVARRVAICRGPER